MPVVAIYARFSSVMQSDSSIEDQVRVCTKYIEGQGWTVDPKHVYTDYAVSGASVARGGFDQLTKAIQAKEVDILVVENTDRLSRDLGDADRLYKTLDFLGVRLICISDGIDTNQRNARQTFTMKSLMADWFLGDLRDKTLRGLQGQALRGFSTGGLAHGYYSEPVGDPRKPEGYRILVDEAKAETVRRIFTLYRDGYSFGRISELLNTEGVESPRGTHWRKTTIREMLKNESYLGAWKFGVKEWRKDPVTRKRRYRKRDASEVQTFERPELRIVPQPLWDAVQARLQEATKKHGKSKVRSVVNSRTPKPLSGLLKCSECGSSMIMIGSGKTYYRCSLAHGGGACSNKRSIRSDALLESISGELHRILTETSLRDVLLRRIEERLAAKRANTPSKAKTLKGRISKLQSEIDRMVAFVRTAPPAAASAVAEEMDKAARQKAELEGQLSQLEAKASEQGPDLPTAEQIAAVASDVSARLAKDPVTGREMLRRLLGGEPIVVAPAKDGHRVTSTIFPIGLVTPKMKKTPGNSGGSEIGESRLLRGQQLPDLHQDFDLGIPLAFEVIPRDRRKKNHLGKIAGGLLCIACLSEPEAGCSPGCDDPPEEFPTPVLEEGEAFAALDAGPSIRSELCWRPPPAELAETYPDFRERFEEAASRWGWTVRWDKSCRSHFRVLEDAEEAEEGIPLAVCDRPKGSEWAQYVGGESWIGFRADAVGERILDLDGESDLAACQEAFEEDRERRYSLRHLLTHELGHILMERPKWHSEQPSSVMYFSATDCVDPLPSEDELGMAVRPH